MEEVKVKKTTFGVINKRYLTGFNGLKYRADQYKTTRGSILSGLPNEYHTAFIYIKKLDVTYVTVTCLGWFSIWGPNSDDPTWVLRYPGKITWEDIKEEENFVAAMEEAGEDYKERSDARRKEEES